MAVRRQRFGRLLLEFGLLVSSFHTVTPVRTKEKIYIDLGAQHGCFRLLNSTHQIGCSSNQEGNTGVVHYMETQADWNYVLKEGTTGPYVPILAAVNFTLHNVRLLAKSGRVAGIAVLNYEPDGRHITVGFSSDLSCPNDAYGMYHNTELGACSKVRWNPTGEGLFFEDISIPIFSITDHRDAITIITQCWEAFNKPLDDGRARTFPLCAMELFAPMSAVRDTVTCLRRNNLWSNMNPVSFCDPLGDNNVLAFLRAVPSNTTRPPGSVVVVATRMDSLGMFYSQYVSSDTSVTGIITLLATASALWKLKEDIAAVPNAKEVMFAFLQGEAFDYIGSSRMVHDMLKGRFPMDLGDDKVKTDVHVQQMNLSHIAQFVELSQVGMRQDEDSLWLHVDPDVRRKMQVQVNSMLDTLTRYGVETNTTFRSPSPDNPLPPASLQRFLKEVPTPFPSFVVTDHREQFTNRFYNSHQDLPWQIQADYPQELNDSQRYEADTVQSRRITALATALARYLFWAATDREPTAAQKVMLQANIKDVNHMLYCFLHTPRCELFNFIISPENANALNMNYQPYSFYVSVPQAANQVTYLTERVLAFLIGEVVPKVDRELCKSTDNDKRYTYMWMNGGQEQPGGERIHVCYRAITHLTKAVSPAFEIEDYDWTSGQFSTWTESRWLDFRVRVFLKPSKQFEVSTLLVGVVFLVVSLIIVYLISASADVLFQSASDDGLDAAASTGRGGGGDHGFSRSAHQPEST